MLLQVAQMPDKSMDQCDTEYVTRLRGMNRMTIAILIFFNINYLKMLHFGPNLISIRQLITEI